MRYYSILYLEEKQPVQARGPLCSKFVSIVSGLDDDNIGRVVEYPEALRAHVYKGQFMSRWAPDQAALYCDIHGLCDCSTVDSRHSYQLHFRRLVITR